MAAEAICINSSLTCITKVPDFGKKSVLSTLKVPDVVPVANCPARCVTGCLRSNSSTCLNALLLLRSEEMSGCPCQFSTVI